MSGAEVLDDGETLFDARHNKKKDRKEDDSVFVEESRNTISAINMERIKTKFTGLSKEELLKFSNDPFWVRIRWFLFVGFWAIWAFMLFAAIFIIVTSPKCAEPAVSLWWQRSPIYEIDIKNLRNVEVENANKTIAEIIKSKLNYLKQLNVQTVLLKSVLLSSGDEGDEIIDYKNVNVSLGSVDTLKELAEFAKSKDMHLLLSFTPNHSSDKNIMFARSILQEEPFKDYYVWASPHDTNTTNHSKPPNNWLSLHGGSAWEWNEKRGQFYLHQFNKTQPDFNFWNGDVIDYFSEVMNFWMDNGISGFHLENTEYLIEDTVTLLDMAVGLKAGSYHDQYEFYSHKRTMDLPETTTVLETWSKRLTNRSGILSVSGGAGERNELMNFVLKPIQLSPNFTANELNTAVKYWIGHVNWPTWKWNCTWVGVEKENEEKECFSENMIDGLMMISFMLPGTPVTYFGQELGFPPDYPMSYYKKYNIFDSSSELYKRMKDMISSTEQEIDSDSHYNVYKSLNNLRSSDTVLFGNYSTRVFNETVFCVIRHKIGNPGYVVLWNLDRRDVIVDIGDFEYVPNELTVVVKSGHSFGNDYAIKGKISSHSIHLPGKGGIVFSFVPV